MIDVVIDTNILVAAFRSKLGASYRLIQTIDSGRWRPIVSPALALEYESVLKRGIGAGGLTADGVDDFLEYFFRRSKLVQIYFRWRPILSDPDDDRILEVAVRASAPIVTFNTRDFRGCEKIGIGILAPRELLVLIEDVQ